jgi:hypothetical protein
VWFSNVDRGIDPENDGIVWPSEIDKGTLRSGLRPRWVDRVGLSQTNFLCMTPSWLAASTHSSIPEPDNSAAVTYMQEKTCLLASPPVAVPVFGESTIDEEASDYLGDL